jgi:hypothetical chaperone protein
MSLTVGLDFGTSNSGVAVSDGTQIRILPVDPHNILPEVVKTILYITRDQQSYIGQEAVELYYRHNVNRIRRYVKKWAGEIDYVGSELHYVRDIYVYVDELKPGRILQYLKTALRQAGSARDYDGTQVFDRYYRIVDLITLYLRTLKKRSEEILHEEINGVTLGRPVKFSDSLELDRQAEDILRQAAIEAGFSAVNFELEPIAAALYFEKTLEKAQNALIFDFGGGTLDIAIMRIGDRHNRHLYASGGIDIAGSNFDRAIIEKRLLPSFGLEQASHIPDIHELIQAVPDWIALPDLSTPQNRYNIEQAIKKRVAPARLKSLQALIFNDLAFSFYDQVESAKIALSKQGATIIELTGKDINIWELYTRLQFEKDIYEYQVKIEKVLFDTISASGLEVGDIDVVVKTGGSSNIPLFSDSLLRKFGADRVRAAHPFNSVAAGLAIRARELA